MSDKLKGVRVCILRSQPVDFDKRTQQIARLLARVGAEVTVVSLVREGYEIPPDAGFRIEPVFRRPSSRRRTWLLRVAANVWNEMRDSVASVSAIHRCKPDVVHAMNVDTLLKAFLGARKRPVIYDSREHFATTGKVKGRVRKWWMLKERLLVPRAAAVLTVTDMIAADLERRYAIAPPTVLVNGCTEHVAEALPPHAPLRLLHQGKFFFDRHLDDVIRAVAAHRGRAVLTLQGWGEAEKQLRELATALGAVNWVSFVPPCPPADVVKCASAHDVGIINIWPDNESHRWTGSNKLFDYMGAGLAQIVTNLDFTRRIVEGEQCGLVVESPTVEGFAAAIGHLLRNPDEVDLMKHNAVAAAPKYTWEAQADKLFGAYERTASAVSAHTAGRETG